MGRIRDIETISRPCGKATDGGETLLDELELNLGPDREPRDEAALLLTVAAEVEHALMVQYLYAAYSLRIDQSNHVQRGRVRGIAERLIQIAREEMGHLMTVQNLLHLIGAPPHFEREDSPFESQLYPFRFKLERLSEHSLAKYIIAESPVDEAEQQTATEQTPQACQDPPSPSLEEIADLARKANDGEKIRHVGMIYARLIELFEDPENGVRDEDFETANVDGQASERDWGFDPGPQGDLSRRVRVDSFDSKRLSLLRDAAVNALRHIADQGEGRGSDIDSHFERFRVIYNDFKKLKENGVDFVWPVATNPNVRSTGPTQPSSTAAIEERARAAFEEQGAVTHPRAVAWGQLFNLRYRLLLGCLMHFLRTTGPRYEADGPDKGDLTQRGLLLLWSFDEMRRIRKIAGKLVRLPLREDDGGLRAGPPFQLPYTMAIADLERSRWRAHRSVTWASLNLLQERLMAKGSPDECDPFLSDLKSADQHRMTILDALADDQPIPADAQPEDFQKVVHILEQAVRGFEIGVHGNFWAGKTRDEFVDHHMFNNPLLNRGDPDTCELVAAGSSLLRVIESTGSRANMPRFRPPIDQSRQKYIREWIDKQAPDGNPPGRVGVHSERDPNLD